MERELAAKWRYPWRECPKSKQENSPSQNPCSKMATAPLVSHAPEDRTRYRCIMMHFPRVFLTEELLRVCFLLRFGARSAWASPFLAGIFLQHVPHQIGVFMLLMRKTVPSARLCLLHFMQLKETLLQLRTVFWQVSSPTSSLGSPTIRLS